MIGNICITHYSIFIYTLTDMLTDMLTLTESASGLFATNKHQLECFVTIFVRSLWKPRILKFSIPLSQIFITNNLNTITAALVYRAIFSARQTSHTCLHTAHIFIYTKSSSYGKVMKNRVWKISETDTHSDLAFCSDSSIAAFFYFLYEMSRKCKNLSEQIC